MTRDEAAYAEQLGQLLPPGAAWSRDPSSILGRLLAALAREFARVDGRAARLIDEASPLTALELLTDWERVAGLPDECLPALGGVRERQIAAGRKIAGLGGQSIAYMRDLAARLAIEVEIDEFGPFVAGSAAGDEVRDDAWAHAFRVRALPPSESTQDAFQLRFSYFRAGSSGAGDLLSSVNADELECVIRRAAPAHAVVLFAYPQDPEPVLWFDFI